MDMYAGMKLARPKRSMSRLVKKSMSLLTMRKTVKQNTNFIDPLDETRPGRPLPQLPPEIWIQIIRAATLTNPDPLDTTHAISFLDPPHQSPLRRCYYRDSMRQKLSFALVSKFWCLHAQEFLYEFVWISRARQAKALAHTLLEQSYRNPKGAQNGLLIRRLHIETPTLERCNPLDLRTILEHSPRLLMYSDYRSVRRNLLEESRDPRSSPEQLFSTLAHPNNSLKWLSWTNYDDVSFHLRMSPMLESTAMNLEFLELNFCSGHLHSMFKDEPTVLPASEDIALHLPALRTLKVTLDNATFHVLSGWSLPALQNLSVVSADFSYASSGFSKFFLIHGSKLVQLELGHSSSTIEEHYLTAPPTTNNGAGGGHHHIPLAAWCPNLKEFICSADAEWNWENPDWIAPHVLLPTHPTLEFIGIRDMDKRLRPIMDAAAAEDSDDEEEDGDGDAFMLLEQISSLLTAETFPSLKYIRDMSLESDEMRRCVPPRKKEVKTGRGRSGTVTSVSSSIMFGVTAPHSSSPPSSGSSHPLPESTRAQIRVLDFWNKVMDLCAERGVWLEDCEGVNVTKRDLRKARAEVQERGKRRVYGFSPRAGGCWENCEDLESSDSESERKRWWW